MNATGNAESATGTRLNVEVFELECARRGAVDDAARGELVGVDRTTVWRWRHGRQKISLEVVARIAKLFDIPVEQLIARGDA